MKAFERAQVLARCPTFARTPRSDLDALAEMMRVETFAGDSSVCEIGDEADGIYVVATGTLSVHIGDPARHVRDLRAGDVLGEYGLFSGGRRTARVRAEVDSVLLFLDYERFRRFLRQYPDALWSVLETTVLRLLAAEKGEAR